MIESARLGTRAIVNWQEAALRLGETLASCGPNGYYAFSASEWLEWALEQRQAVPAVATPLEAGKADPSREKALEVALELERLARQQAETDAIGSRDELNILKVKHAADVLARQQAERELANAIEAIADRDAQWTRLSIEYDNLLKRKLDSEQARAQAEQDKARLRTALETENMQRVAMKVRQAWDGGYDAVRFTRDELCDLDDLLEPALTASVGPKETP